MILRGEENMFFYDQALALEYDLIMVEANELPSK